MERHGNPRKNKIIRWLQAAAWLDTAGFLLAYVGFTRLLQQLPSDPLNNYVPDAILPPPDYIAVFGLGVCAIALMALVFPKKSSAIATSVLLFAQPMAFITSVFVSATLCSILGPCTDNFILEGAVYMLMASALVLLVTVSAQVWGWWQSRKTRQA